MGCMFHILLHDSHQARYIHINILNNYTRVGKLSVWRATYDFEYALRAGHTMCMIFNQNSTMLSLYSITEAEVSQNEPYTMKYRAILKNSK